MHIYILRGRRSSTWERKTAWDKDAYFCNGKAVSVDCISKQLGQNSDTKQSKKNWVKTDAK